jgi:ABC-2 type transport system permease protein
VLRSITLKTIRDRWRSLIWWSVAILVYSMFVAAFWPVLADQQEQFTTLLQAYPEGLLNIFGVGSIEDMFTPAGFLSTEAFGWLVPLLFAIFATVMGAQLIAGEEEDNTLDLLLSNPVSRTRVAVEKWLGMVAVTAVLGVALFLSVVAAGAAFDLAIPVSHYAAACFQALLLGLVFGSLAFAIGAIGGRRGLILGAVAAFAVGTFLINALSDLADWLKTVSYISPFRYYDSNTPLVNGIDWAFPRRDIGT